MLYPREAYFDSFHRWILCGADIFHMGEVGDGDVYKLSDEVGSQIGGLQKARHHITNRPK